MLKTRCLKGGEGGGYEPPSHKIFGKESCEFQQGVFPYQQFQI